MCPSKDDGRRQIVHRSSSVLLRLLRDKAEVTHPVTTPSLGPVIKVLLIGSQPVSLAGLRALIDNDSGMEVVGQREHPKDAAASASSETPDIALIDHAERDMVEPLTAMAKAADIDTRFLMVTSSTDTALLSNAFRLGARGLVSKHQAPEVLIDAIHKVHEGEIWLDRAATTQLITDLLRTSKTKPKERRASSLTLRGRRIVALVAQGLKNGQIAEELCVSEATIRNQLTSIFRKLGVTGRLQLVVYACQHGFVKPPETTQRTPGGKLRLV